MNLKDNNPIQYTIMYIGESVDAIQIRFSSFLFSIKVPVGYFRESKFHTYPKFSNSFEILQINDP